MHPKKRKEKKRHLEKTPSKKPKHNDFDYQLLEHVRLLMDDDLGPKPMEISYDDDAEEFQDNYISGNANTNVNTLSRLQKITKKPQLFIPNIRRQLHNAFYTENNESNDVYRSNDINQNDINQPVYHNPFVCGLCGESHNIVPFENGNRNSDNCNDIPYKSDIKQDQWDWGKDMFKI